MKIRQVLILLTGALTWMFLAVPVLQWSNVFTLDQLLLATIVPPTPLNSVIVFAILGCLISLIGWGDIRVTKVK